MSNFSKLGLSDLTCEVLDQLGFENPTPIQTKAIPLLLSKDPTDFIGLAQTGTGKTAAFGLPLLELIDVDIPATQAVILAPTRELSQQTAQQLISFKKSKPGLNIEVVYGGANIVNQIKALKRPTQIVVATPGRLQDLIDRKAIKLDQVQYVILDEADEMLNMGFKEPIDKILSYTPDHRVTWLFSATMPKEIRRIVDTYMIQPEEASIKPQEMSNKDISHQYVVTKTANKLPAVRRFLDQDPDMRGIMFCRTRRETQEITDQLTGLGYGVEALHGELSQAQRDAAMKRFKARSMQLLIATDVAARGIDVNDLTHVFHHTLPDQLESYTHRSGRTGRAGNKGISLALINPRQGSRISELEKKLKIQFEKVEVPSSEELKKVRMDHWASLIVNTQIDDQADEILFHLKDRFDHMSKDDLLKRLITTQLDHLITQGDVTGDLNEYIGKDKRREETASSASDDSLHRFFINVGSMDGVTKGDLIHFISDISQVKRKHIVEVDLRKNCSYFSLDAKLSKNLGQKFDGIEVEGRAIRVNRDDDGGRKKKPERRKPKSGMRSNSRNRSHMSKGKPRKRRR